MDNLEQLRLPFIKLYTGEYRKLTATLKPAERGAFMELVLYFWDTGKFPPDDDEQLARITLCTKSEWQKIRPALTDFCFEVCDGYWRQPYFEQAYKKDAELHQKNVEKGKKGAQTRWKDNVSKNA